MSWWQDDCACPVTDTTGDGCSGTTDTDNPTHLCRHCDGHAKAQAKAASAVMHATLRSMVVHTGSDEVCDECRHDAAELLAALAPAPSKP
jgi:hypothetical protein